MAEDQALETLAEAVLDGAAVDWATTAALADADTQPLIRGLRLVASVARLHRDVLSDDPGNATWGHLRLLEHVGRGSSGEVFRAWESQLDREVALKLLPAPPGNDDAIIREGQLLAKVRHPNVVTIYGASQIDDCIGLWMEFVRGHTLEHLVVQRGAFRPADVIAMGLELCRAVSAVHDAGLLHRDIKAQNVMLADDGRVVLMDFGTGHALEDGATAEVAGTPLYLAPELLRREPASAQSDIYSLGVLLYRLASGAYPVRGKSIAILRAAHERGEHVPLRAAAPATYARLARIVDQAIDPNPERRFATVTALGKALLQLQRRDRRKPMLYAASVAAVLAVPAFMAWTVWPAPDPPTMPATNASPAVTLAAAGLAPATPTPPRTGTQDRGRPASILVEMANSAFERGDLAKAIELAEEAARVARGSSPGQQAPLALALCARARVLFASDQSGPAAVALDEAGAIARAMADGADLDRILYEIAFSRARVALDQGAPYEARDLAQKAVDVARRASRRDAEAAAAGLVVLTWLAEKNFPAVQQALGLIEQGPPATGNRLMRMFADLAVWRGRAATAETPDANLRAKQNIGAVLRAAASTGDVAIEFEARLALGEVEMAAGDVTWGRSRLLTLAHDAAAKGFARLAKRAAAAAQ
jgi:serine/threonine protein kinase